MEVENDTSHFLTLGHFWKPNNQVELYHFKKSKKIRKTNIIFLKLALGEHIPVALQGHKPYVPVTYSSGQILTLIRMMTRVPATKSFPEKFTIRRVQPEASAISTLLISYSSVSKILLSLSYSLP